MWKEREPYYTTQNVEYLEANRRPPIYDFNQDKYRTFDDVELSYLDIHRPTKDNIYFEWNYKETPRIPFIISYLRANIEDPEICYLDETAYQNIEITFLNFRFEEVKTWKLSNVDKAIIYIDAETSENYFKKGLYYAQIKLQTYANKEIKVYIDSAGNQVTEVVDLDETTLVDTKILLNGHDCLLRVN